MPGQRGVDEGGMLGDMSNMGSWGVQGRWGQRCAEVVMGRPHLAVPAQGWHPLVCHPLLKGQAQSYR